VRILAIALIVLALAALGALAGSRPGPVWPALWLLVLAVPAGLFSTYLATLRRIRNMAVWSAGSHALAWLSGPWLRVLTGVGAAFAATAFLAPRLMNLQAADGVLLGLALLVFLALRWLLMRQLQSQLQPVYRTGWPLWWIAVLTAMLMVLADMAVRHTGALAYRPATLAQAIDQARSTAHALGPSALAQAVADWAGLIRGLELFLLARAHEVGGLTGWLVRPLVALTQLPFHFFVALSIAAFVVPGREYARILTPPQALDEAAPVPAHRLAAAASLVAALVLFVFLPLVVMTESQLQQSDRHRLVHEKAHSMAVELVDGVLVRPGTAAELRQLQIEAVLLQQDALQQVNRAIDEGFDGLRANTDRYLDWYYSLSAEYVRLFSAATGGLEAHLSRQLQQTLGAGDPFSALNTAISQAMQLEARLAGDVRSRAIDLLESRRVHPAPGVSTEVVGTYALDDMLDLTRHEGLTTLEQRFAAGGATGVVSALVARQVVMRLAARGTVRMAASTLSRAALARSGAALGGAGAGAATGAAVGSVIPGFGTAAGALVGGVVGGLGVGLGAEYLLLKTEELFRRDAHRQSLLDAIGDIEKDLRDQLVLPPGK